MADDDLPNGWTANQVRTFMLALLDERERRYLDRFESSEKAVAAALAAAGLAVDKAELNAEKWRNNANEWRQAMDDRERRFLAKDEATLMIGALSRRVEDGFGRVDNQITALADYQNRDAGRQEGITTTQATALAILAILLPAIAVVITIVLHH